MTTIIEDEAKFKDFYFNSEMKLQSVEENVLLWERKTEKGNFYIYTDFLGNPFHKIPYFYATPFSNGLALVKTEEDFQIIDKKEKQIVLFPKDINFRFTNGQRNGNIAIFNGSLGHWGSIKYQRKGNLFKEDIPYIWDTLEFGRNPEIVYVGKVSLRKTLKDDIEAHRYRKKWLFLIKSVRMMKERAYDEKYYQEMMEFFFPFDACDRDIRYIERRFDNKLLDWQRKTQFQELIQEYFNISDNYFMEKSFTKSNNSVILPNCYESFDAYSLIRGKKNY